MGLAGQKRRNKISADPNNTAWAKSETNYGHRLLAKSGWKPGQYLGAENANHADHYTAANASHIRVVLREDNAGLGAQKGKSNADTFGLSTLSGIFGRLNGKSEVEVQKQADTQRDLQLQSYQSQKWGSMNFIYGGLLVGDKMEEEKLAEATANSKRKLEETTPTEPVSSKKRKHDSREFEAASESSSDDAEAAKEKRKQKKRSKKGGSATETSSDVAEEVIKKERKKDGKSADSDEKSQAKAEKRARKEARRQRKEEKRRRKEAKGQSSTQPSRDQSSDSSSDEDSTKPAVPATTAQPAAMAFGGSRHAVRQRYIMQKRQAGMNPQAMAEILMLKSTA